MFSNTYILKIGSFAIKLFCKTNREISFDSGYIPFITSENISNPSTEIEIIESIPEDLRNEDKLIFESNDETKKLWHICKLDDGYKVIVFNPLLPNKIQQIAIIPASSYQWKIYCELNENNLLMPFSYPMGPIILYYLTTVNNAIMIHSSGIIDGKKGRLFSGFSGAGKSTMAEIWKENGHPIINDDRLLLAIEDEKVIMHNTPMFYEDNPKSNQLQAIYLLKQTQENCIRQLNNAEAISRLLAFCIQHSYDKQFLEHHLTTIFDIYNLIPIYELGFKPDTDIIDFIRSHEL